MDDIVGRLQSAFPSHQLDVIIGSLLGDARLECRSQGIRASYTARFRVHHGEKQKDYVYWKYHMLKDLVSREPYKIKWRNEKRNLNEVSWFFHTKTLKNFGIIHEIFYKNGRKIFPKEILPIFTDVMLAVWFKDRHQWKIAIGSFDYQRFIDTITPYIPKAMSYKIGNPRIDLLSRKRAEPATLVGANTSVSG